MKVMSKGSTKMSLSMRDVDQATGQDLMPISQSVAAKADEIMRSNPSANPNGGGPGSQQSLKGLSGARLLPADCNCAQLPYSSPPLRAMRFAMWVVTMTMTMTMTWIQYGNARESNRGSGGCCGLFYIHCHRPRKATRIRDT